LFEQAAYRPGRWESLTCHFEIASGNVFGWLDYAKR